MNGIAISKKYMEFGDRSLATTDYFVKLRFAEQPFSISEVFEILKNSMHYEGQKLVNNLSEDIYGKLNAVNPIIAECDVYEKTASSKKNYKDLIVPNSSRWIDLVSALPPTKTLMLKSEEVKLESRYLFNGETYKNTPKQDEYRDDVVHIFIEILAWKDVEENSIKSKSSASLVLPSRINIDPENITDYIYDSKEIIRELVEKGIIYFDEDSVEEGEDPEEYFTEFASWILEDRKILYESYKIDKDSVSKMLTLILSGEEFYRLYKENT